MDFFKVLEHKIKSYFHLSLIQEYLAALFVTQSCKNLKRLWDETQWNYKYINVWAYYLEWQKVIPKEIKTSLLTTGLSLSWLPIGLSENLSKKILQDKIKCLYLVYCLMELPHEKINQQADKGQSYS